MHTWHLGCGQDVVGTCIKLMCSTQAIYGARTIPARLNMLFQEVKDYAKQQGHTVSLKRLRKHTVKWGKGCPEFHAKASDTPVFLGYLVHKLRRHPIPQPYAGLLGVAWAADQMCGCIMNAGVFLTAQEQHHMRVVGGLFLGRYLAMARIARDNGQFYFKVRPKLHYLQHLLEDDRPSMRSPGHDNCFVFEDHVKQCIHMLRVASHRTAELNLLKRNCVQVKQFVLKQLGC